MKMKQKYKIGKILSLATLMAIANACNKDPVPQPTPDQPTTTDTITPPTHDTITPGHNDTIPEPWREAVIPWLWGGGMGLVPPRDSIEFYTNDPTVKYVFIYIMQVSTMGSTWEPRNFKKARDSLQTRIDINPDKVRGRGIIKVGTDGAHIHPDTLTEKFGMWEPDSSWFTQNGWRIGRFFDNKQR